MNSSTEPVARLRPITFYLGLPEPRPTTQPGTALGLRVGAGTTTGWPKISRLRTSFLNQAMVSGTRIDTIVSCGSISGTISRPTQS